MLSELRSCRSATTVEALLVERVRGRSCIVVDPMDSVDGTAPTLQCTTCFEYPSYVCDTSQKALCVTSVRAQAAALTRAPVDICAVIDRSVQLPIVFECFLSSYLPEAKTICAGGLLACDTGSLTWSKKQQLSWFSKCAAQTASVWSVLTNRSTYAAHLC